MAMVMATAKAQRSELMLRATLKVTAPRRE